MTELSEKQRAFARAVAAGQEPEAAAEGAGYAVQQRGWRAEANMRNEKVLAMIALIRAGGGPGSDIGPDRSADASRETVTRMLNADRRLAYRKGSASAAISATVAIAKINGLIADRRPPDGKPLTEMSDAELAAHLDALEREARAVLATDGGKQVSSLTDGEP